MLRILLKNFLKALLFLLLCIGFSYADVPKAHEDCTRCHVEEGSPVLIKGIIETCIDCHPNSNGREHPVNVVQKERPGNLPLNKENKITCITCHEPHGRDTADRMLRMEFNKLCVVCHKLP